VFENREGKKKIKIIKHLEFLKKSNATNIMLSCGGYPTMF